MSEPCASCHHPYTDADGHTRCRPSGLLAVRVRTVDGQCEDFMPKVVVDNTLPWGVWPKGPERKRPKVSARRGSGAAKKNPGPRSGPFWLPVPNVELRGRAAGEGPVERSGTNLSAGLGGADIGDSK